MKQENEININYGPTYDPFTYGWQSDSGYRVPSKTDKYVTSGNYDSQTNELDLNIKGSDTVKIKLEGVEGQDEKVTGGTSEITEEKQVLTLDVGTKDGEISKKVNIDLSGMKNTYYSKSEINEKLTWEEF